MNNFLKKMVITAIFLIELFRFIVEFVIGFFVYVHEIIFAFIKNVETWYFFATNPVLATNLTWINEKRNKLTDYFMYNIRSGKEDVSVSPSGNYIFYSHLSKYTLCSRGKCYLVRSGVVIDKRNQKVISEITSDHNFAYIWIQGKCNDEYLLCSEDNQGYTVVNCKTKSKETFLPEKVSNNSGFCWNAFYLSPNKKILAVQLAKPILHYVRGGGLKFRNELIDSPLPPERKIAFFKCEDFPKLRLIKTVKEPYSYIKGWVDNDTFLVIRSVQKAISSKNPILANLEDDSFTMYEEDEEVYISCR